MSIEVSPRNTVRGAPRTTGNFECARCHRRAGKARIRWPEGRICGICFHHAMRNHGKCGRCSAERLLPGLDGSTPICAPCAGISPITCGICGVEAEHYRVDCCARCALREDLCDLLGAGEFSQRFADALSSGSRPESVFAWLRSPEAKDLVRRLGTGELPLTHEALDAEPASKRVEHLRSMLEGFGFLAQRDHHLALFERWLDAKFDAVDDPAIRHPVEQFARWHHLARIRAKSKPGTGSRGPVHSAKQEITETLKFLTWLKAGKGVYLAGCSQLDVNEYLASGPTTRNSIRTFFVWATRSGVKRGIQVAHRQARSEPTLTQDQRLEWIRELITGSAESLPYRVAGLLLLVFAQPLVRIVELRRDNIGLSPDGIVMTFGDMPVPVPEPFATLIVDHLEHLPNQRNANRDSEWLFPSSRGGRHIHANALMDRLRSLGINLLGARNRTLRDLVSEVPAPVVAGLLGYSDKVTHRHAVAIAVPMSRYATALPR